MLLLIVEKKKKKSQTLASTSTENTIYNASVDSVLDGKKTNKPQTLVHVTTPPANTTYNAASNNIFYGKDNPIGINNCPPAAGNHVYSMPMMNPNMANYGVPFYFMPRQQ